jgi:opine dehydrogenase
MSGAVAVLGAGAGGAAAAAELASEGWRVRLWHPRAPRLEAFARTGAVEHDGVLGDGRQALETCTTDIDAALDGAVAAVVCLPAVAHGAVIDALVGARSTVPVVLNPGHTGGALHVRAGFERAGRAAPPIAAFSTLTYVARSHRPGSVTVTGVARRVHAAALPGGEPALDAARQLFPQAAPARDVIAVDLANVNLVLHPPGAVLGAAWVEATGGDFAFYTDGMTPGVVRVLEALDAERLAVARAYGHDLPPIAEEMAAIGTADPEAAGRGDTRGAIAGGAANATIRAPDSLAHRYYQEDFSYGLVPFIVLAAAAGVPVPVAGALLRLGETLTGAPLTERGLDAERLGIEGLDAAGVLRLVQRDAVAAE